MTYPSTITVYPERVDRNASGWYTSGEYFNVPASTPYQMYLDHVPKDAATTHIFASGGSEWTEDLTGSPAAGEFYVDYSTGLVSFNATTAGTALEARYETLGDDIFAEHINNMQNEVYGIELTLGQDIKGAHATLSARLDTLASTGDTKPASLVSITTPNGITATTVQEFIDSSGTSNRNSTNPLGIGWQDIYNSAGDMVRTQNNITTGYLYANTVTASGNQIGINSDGPDGDQWMYFYDGSSPIGRYLKWNDGSDRFDLNADLMIQGAISPSGMKVGTSQVDAGAAAFELWADSTASYTVKLGQ